jgi:hypothetical protein
MARQPTGVLIVPGDDDYTAVWTAWDQNGRPRRFDRMGAFGGAIYNCYDISVEEPDFYRSASLGPTVYDDDSASSSPTQTGWWHLNRKYMRLKVRRRRDGRYRIRRPVIPNEL